MYGKTVIYNNGQQQQVSPGDLQLGAEVIGTNTTVGASTLSAQNLLVPILMRSGSTAGYTDTTDTSQNIIAAMLGASGNSQAGIQPGTTWRFRLMNMVAFALTMAAGTGVTIANANVNASSVKDFLITVTNGSNQSTVTTAVQTNGSAVITGMMASQTALITPGMLVTGSGIPGGTTVNSVQPGVGVTLSANATSSLTNNTLVFNPTITMQGIGQGLL
jgi:hypothetical protein